jgi:hypothetical protein
VLTGWFTGWLLLAAAVVVGVLGVVARAYIGRTPPGHPLRRTARAVRWSGFGRVMFGPMPLDDRGNKSLDDQELDHMIVMPTLIVGCGLILTGVFLLFYQLVEH